MKKTIVTHSSRFHADDVCAVAVLQLVFGEDSVDIVRTRDQSIIEKADIVVDVGGIYDPKKLRFDHHQKTFTEVRDNGIPYASFGLVWKEYGEKLAGSKEAMEILDQKIVQAIDAGDNGVQTYKLIYDDVNPYTLSSMISAYMPTWKEESSYDTAFLEAVAVVKKSLIREIVRIKDSLEAQAIIAERYVSASNKELIVFNKEDDFGDGDIQFALEQYDEPLIHIRYRHSDDSWSAKCVRGGEGVFSNRMDFPESWAALEHEALQKETGVVDAVFCHRGRFLCIAKSLKGAKELATKAIAMRVDKKNEVSGV